MSSGVVSWDKILIREEERGAMQARDAVWTRVRSTAETPKHGRRVWDMREYSGVRVTKP